MMNFVLWILLGLVAGWLASVIMKTDSAQGPLLDIVIGILGAVVGGFIMNFLGASSVTGFNMYSLLVATFGAVVLIWLRRVLVR